MTINNNNKKLLTVDHKGTLVKKFMEESYSFVPW